MTKKNLPRVAITAFALTLLGGGTSVLAQQAGEARDSAAAPDARRDMPMMEHGNMRGDSSMREMMSMMRMMRRCMKMMDSMGMETDTMPMMDGMHGGSAAPGRGPGMMEDRPMNMDAGTPDGADGDSVPEAS